MGLNQVEASWRNYWKLINADGAKLHQKIWRQKFLFVALVFGRSCPKHSAKKPLPRERTFSENLTCGRIKWSWPNFGCLSSFGSCGFHWLSGTFKLTAGYRRNKIQVIVVTFSIPYSTSKSPPGAKSFLAPVGFPALSCLSPNQGPLQDPNVSVQYIDRLCVPKQHGWQWAGWIPECIQMA